LTVSIAVEKQPVVVSLYVIVEVPAVMPKAIPEELPIVATDVVLLLHVPPPVVLVSVVADPTHTLKDPLIGFGAGFTVTVVVAKQPPGAMYDMMAVPPDIPVMTPVVRPADATSALLLNQEPPASVLANVVVAPSHNVVVPVIAVGCAYIVTVNACVLVPLTGHWSSW
jgi:hypothetical protein